MTKKPILPRDLKEARRQRRLLQEQLQLRLLQRQEELLESLDTWSQSDWWSRSDPWDRTGEMSILTRGSISIPSDRRHGDNWPIFRTEQELNRIRQDARILLATNGYAQGLLQNLRNYVLGKGFTFRAVAKKTARGEGLSGLVEQIQSEIDAFAKANAWVGRQQEGFDRSRRDGEFFLRYFDSVEGLQVRFIEPERIQNPPGATGAEGWNYGIRHQMQPEDVETVLEYHLAAADPTNGQVGEYVPVEEILHLKINVDRNIKRGLTDFCFDTLAALRRATKLQRNLSESAAIQAAIAEIVQFETARKSDVEDYVDARADYTFNRPNQNNGRDVNLQRIEPGTIRRIPKGQTYVPPPFSQGIPTHLQVIQGDLRNAGQAFSAPEYLASGDYSNGNFASTKEAGTPFVKNSECLQEFYKEAFLTVAKRAIRNAIDNGRLPSDVLALVEIQVEAPAVTTTNILELAQRDQIQVGLGAKSPQTVAMESGLDPDQEINNIEEYRERLGSEGPPLPLPDDQGNLQ